MAIQEKRQHRKAEMFALITQQIQSGLSQIKFCKQKQLSIATFSYWRQQYTAQKKGQSSTKFIPIKIKRPSKTQDKNSSLIEIQLPNQIILRCQDWSSHQLSSLISELQGVEYQPKGS